MKTMLAAVMLTFCAAIAQASEITSWATAVSKQEGTGRTIVFRYAKSFREGFKKTAFSDRIILVWRYKSEGGMPIASEREAMDRMEDLLAPLVDAPSESVLALVSTGENLREWTFYAKSEPNFLVALNKLLSGKPRFPIEVHAAPDPQWSTYERLRQGVRE